MGIRVDPHEIGVPLEEDIVNVQVRGPYQGAGVEKVARVARADAGWFRVFAGLIQLTGGGRPPAQDKS